MYHGHVRCQYWRKLGKVSVGTVYYLCNFSVKSKIATNVYCSFFFLMSLLHPNFHKYRTCESEVAQSCPTLCNPMDCSLPGSSVHGIFQAIVLEWIAISFSRGSSQPKDQTRVSCIVDKCFTIWAPREVLGVEEALKCGLKDNFYKLESDCFCSSRIRSDFRVIYLPGCYQNNRAIS